MATARRDGSRNSVPRPGDAAYAEAIVSEQAAVARANAIFDQNLSDIATEKLDSVLMLLDILIAARRLDVADAGWVLPAMGYSVDGIEATEETEDDVDD
jgi:anti-sigma factor ChrR (cupin superfamily)